MTHKRYYIRKGDKTTAGGIVTEGVVSFMMHDKLTAFDTASVWCPVCKVEGHISIVGPRRPFTLPNNREIAMEGDLCLCKCDPPPHLLASQNVAWMQFERDELACMGYGENGVPFAQNSTTSNSFISFTLSEIASLSGTRCEAHFDDGTVAMGIFDQENKVRFENPSGKICKRFLVSTGLKANGETFASAYLSTLIG